MATILIIDDSELHRSEVRSALVRDGCFERILEASDGVGGLQRLFSESVDIVLCDLELPGLDGEQILRLKQEKPATRDVPFVFATASVDLERRLRLLEGGANDLIQKPFHPREVLARLKVHLQIKQLRDELVSKNAVLAQLSMTDELTGLRNRRYLDELLPVEVMRARRYGTPLSVMMADIDHFKAINDRYGHQSGDAVIRGTADRLREGLRSSDLAGRYGGEEFLVVLSHGDHEGALHAAERWRMAVAREPFVGSDGQAIDATISIGIATLGSATDSPVALIGAADEALYSAKRAGRNCVQS